MVLSVPSRKQKSGQVERISQVELTCWHQMPLVGLFIGFFKMKIVVGEKMS